MIDWSPAPHFPGLASPMPAKTARTSPILSGRSPIPPGQSPPTSAPAGWDHATATPTPATAVPHSPAGQSRANPTPATHSGQIARTAVPGANSPTPVSQKPARNFGSGHSPRPPGMTCQNRPVRQSVLRLPMSDSCAIGFGRLGDRPSNRGNWGDVHRHQKHKSPVPHRWYTDRPN